MIRSVPTNSGDRIYVCGVHGCEVLVCGVLTMMMSMMMSMMGVVGMVMGVCMCFHIHMINSYLS